MCYHNLFYFSLLPFVLSSSVLQCINCSVLSLYKELVEHRCSSATVMMYLSETVNEVVPDTFQMIFWQTIYKKHHFLNIEKKTYVV